MILKELILLFGYLRPIWFLFLDKSFLFRFFFLLRLVSFKYAVPHETLLCKLLFLLTSVIVTYYITFLFWINCALSIIDKTYIFFIYLDDNMGQYYIPHSCCDIYWDIFNFGETRAFIFMKNIVRRHLTFSIWCSLSCIYHIHVWYFLGIFLA